MRNVLHQAVRVYHRKRFLLLERLELPVILLRIWWNSPADAAEGLRYINSLSPRRITPTMMRIREALQRRAAAPC